MKARTLISILILVLAVLLISSCTTTRLNWSAERGDYVEVKKLIEEGADVNAQDKQGFTALMIASKEGNIEIAKLLIEEGANVNAEDEMGFTALMLASRNGHIAIVKLLIESGADINAKVRLVSYHTESVSIWGSIFGGGEIRRYYINPSTALMAASSEGHTEIVKLLIESGADVCFRDEEGFTALKWASSEGHIDIVKLLREAGAKE